MLVRKYRRNDFPAYVQNVQGRAKDHAADKWSRLRYLSDYHEHILRNFNSGRV